MRHTTRLAILLAALAGPTAISAQDVYLVAKAGQVDPGGAAVPIWGFVETDSSLDATGVAPALPGPTIRRSVTGAPLRFYVKNELATEVSLVIPGLPVSLSPVSELDPQGRARVRSFTTEVAAGTAGIYELPTLRPGTYLFHSGTRPHVQVPMGLTGVLVVTSSATEPYPGLSVDAERVVVWSELDASFNRAVANGTFGTSTYPSISGYTPSSYLANGQLRPTSIQVGDPGQLILLRLVNAGLESRTLSLVGSTPDLGLIAEDGFLYPFTRSQHSVLVPAGRTVDALLPTAQVGILGLLDGSNGILDHLQIGPAAPQDITAPTITAVVSPAPNAVGWNAGSVTVQLSAADEVGGSGVAGISYAAGGDQTIPPTGVESSLASVQVSGEGHTTLKFSAYDQAGNASSPQSLHVRIDLTPPVTLGSATSTGTSMVVTLSPTDALSGVGITTYSLDGGDVTTYTGPFTVTSPGTHTVAFASSDRAGNQEATKFISFTVAPPVGSLPIYFSTQGGQVIPGVTTSSRGADIYLFDGVSFSRVFDSRVPGIAGNIDALEVIEPNFFFASFAGEVKLPGLKVGNEDVVLYYYGTWRLVFDGSDVGLGDAGLDAIYLPDDGSIVISTTKNAAVPPLPGTQRREDLLRCQGSFGPTTTCTWSLYFDGSDIGLGALTGSNVDGAAVAGNGLLLSVQPSISLAGQTLSAADVFRCEGAVTGVNSQCPGGITRVFDAAALGLASTVNIDAFDFVR